MSGLEILSFLPQFIQIASGVIQTIRTLKNAGKEAEAIARHIEVVQAIAEDVQDRVKRSSHAYVSGGAYLQGNDVTSHASNTPLLSGRAPLLMKIEKLSPLFDELNDIFKKFNKELVQKQGLRKALKSIKWLESKDEVKSLLDTLERLKSSLSLAVANDSRALSLQVSQAVSDLHEDFFNEFEQIKEEIGDIHDDAVQRKKEKLIEKLLSKAGDVLETDIKPTLPSLRNYGRWFIGSEPFKEWCTTLGSSLWCEGQAGAGKTTLSAIAADYLRTAKGSEKVAVLEVYCDYKRATRLEGVLACLWLQLFQKRKSVTLRETDRLYTRYIEERRQLDSDEWAEELLANEFSYLDQAFIVIDALDEFDKQFPTKLVEKLQRTKHANVMYTSRNPIPIAHLNSVRGLNQTIVEAHSDDLRRYVHDRLPSGLCVSEKILENPKLALRIEEKVVASANGIFQIGQVLLNNLVSDEIVTLRDIDKILENPYNNVKEAYDSTFERLAGSRMYLGITAICIVATAKSSLTLEQLCQLVSIRPGQVSLSREDLISGELLLKYCGGLVRFLGGQSIVHLHSTVSEYIERYRQDDAEKAQTTLASSCMTYLCFPEFAIQHWRNRGAIQRLIDDHPLLEYSALYWGDHLRELSSDKAAALRSKVEDLIRKEENMACAARVLLYSKAQWFVDGHQWAGWLANQHAQGLVRATHLVAYFGLEKILDDLLLAHPDITIMDPENEPKRHRRHPFGSILHWAAFGGHEATLRRVLRQPGAEQLLNLTDVDLWHAPLHIALRFSKTRAVQLLLEAGADPRVQVAGRRQQWHSLQLAIHYGPLSHVDILLKSPYGRDLLGQKDITGDVALHSCVKKDPYYLNDSEILRTLLPYYEEAINEGVLSLESLLDKRGQNPIHWAARLNLRYGVIVFLDGTIGLGFDLLEQEDPRQISPLEVLCQTGDWITLMGCTFFEREDKRRLNLQARFADSAAKRGRDAILKYLLKQNGEILHMSMDDMRICFASAAAGGSVECLKAIRTYHEPTTTDLQHALTTAVQHGHHEILPSLVAMGAQVNYTDALGRTALHLAAKLDSVEVVKTLLNLGCQPWAQDASGKTALDFAQHNNFKRTSNALLYASRFDPPPSPSPNGQFLVSTPKLNPHWRPYCPVTPSDVFAASFYLLQAFSRSTTFTLSRGPRESLLPLTNVILEHARYWLRSRTIHHHRMVVTDLDADIVYLRTPPLVGRPCQMHMLTSSHDETNRHRLGVSALGSTGFDVAGWNHSGRAGGVRFAMVPSVRVITNKMRGTNRSTNREIMVTRGKEGNKQLQAFLRQFQKHDRICLMASVTHVGGVLQINRAQVTVWTSVLKGTAYVRNAGAEAKSCIKWWDESPNESLRDIQTVQDWERESRGL